MRARADAAKIRRFMAEFGQAVRGPGRVYLAGGASAVLLGFRESTLDVDLKFDPEPAGAFEAIRDLKDRLDINVELATPEDFIPVPEDQRRGGLWIVDHGGVQFYHYDLTAQALAKIERGHTQDLADARALIARGLVQGEQIRKTFARIQSDLQRYPALDPDDFRARVEQFLGSPI